MTVRNSSQVSIIQQYSPWWTPKRGLQRPFLGYISCVIREILHFREERLSMKACPYKRSAQTGFTLVEIAIVLVIIGLLLGGILKGQEMITQAKIKNVITDFNVVTAAYHGYQDRYRAIPGDDPNAGTRWTTAPPAFPGSGNGVVDGTYNTACPTVVAAGTAETCKWWDDLRRAGFVSGNRPQQPFNALTGPTGDQTGDGP